MSTNPIGGGTTAVELALEEYDVVKTALATASDSSKTLPEQLSALQTLQNFASDGSNQFTLLDRSGMSGLQSSIQSAITSLASMPLTLPNPNDNSQQQLINANNQPATLEDLIKNPNQNFSLVGLIQGHPSNPNWANGLDIGGFVGTNGKPTIEPVEVGGQTIDEVIPAGNFGPSVHGITKDSNGNPIPDGGITLSVDSTTDYDPGACHNETTQTPYTVSGSGEALMAYLSVSGTPSSAFSNITM